MIVRMLALLADLDSVLCSVELVLLFDDGFGNTLAQDKIQTEKGYPFVTAWLT